MSILNRWTAGQRENSIPYTNTVCGLGGIMIMINNNGSDSEFELRSYITYASDLFFILGLYIFLLAAIHIFTKETVMYCNIPNSL